LADGRIVKTGNRARKTSAGYDLTHLFVGSEGTLGVITEAVLKLHRIPNHSASFILPFPSPQKAMEITRTLINSDLDVRRCEFMFEPHLFLYIF